MIAAVIPFYVVAFCNISHVVLAIFFFPSIVEFFDNLYWRFNHRSWFIEYQKETDFGAKSYFCHSKHSILINKADMFERNNERTDFVNYYSGEDRDFNVYLMIRENRKFQQMAEEDGVLVRKQNFRARIHERMIEQPVLTCRKLARTR